MVMGDPQTGWFISWKIQLEWMMTGGTPIAGNLHIDIITLRKTLGPFITHCSISGNLHEELQ